MIIYNYNSPLQLLLMLFIQYYRAIGLMSRVFANGPGDRGSIPGRVIPKTQKMVLGVALLNTQHYKAQLSIALKGHQLHWINERYHSSRFNGYSNSTPRVNDWSFQTIM